MKENITWYSGFHNGKYGEKPLIQEEFIERYQMTPMRAEKLLRVLHAVLIYFVEDHDEPDDEIIRAEAQFIQQAKT